MESGSGGEAYGDRVGVELARLREAVDDLRRRPLALDVDTLRHVVTASLTEASAPPPNLLVTAIRRLDRVDARLESIEALLGGPTALPRPQQNPALARPRPPAMAPAPPVSYVPPPPDAEAIAEALARRLAGILSAPQPVVPGGGAGIDAIVAALRPLVPEAARSVLRRAGREPSPQAVEVLQQTALIALEEAVDSLRTYGFAPSGPAPERDPRRFAPPAALAPPAAPIPAPAPPPIDVEALAATIAARVAAAVAEVLPAPVEAPPPPPPPEVQDPPPPAVDPSTVADAVIARLEKQPPPQAVLSAMAMAPLLSAVGNVEAAVARIADPDAEAVSVVGRLEAGIDALARALEDDRAVQAEELRQGFATLQETMAARPALADAGLVWAAGAPDTDLEPGDHDAPEAAGEAPGADQVRAAVRGVQRRLDELTSRLGSLAEADLGTTIPDLAAQGQRLERSIGHILTALAALAEHLQDQSGLWQDGVDRLAARVDPARREGGDGLHDDVAGLAARLDELVAGTAADRQRFQRLGGTIDGLAELLGQLSERLDRLPREERPRPPTPREPGELAPDEEDVPGTNATDAARPAVADSAGSGPEAATEGGTGRAPRDAGTPDPHEAPSRAVGGAGSWAAFTDPAADEHEVDEPDPREAGADNSGRLLWAPANGPGVVDSEAEAAQEPGTDDMEDADGGLDTGESVDPGASRSRRRRRRSGQGHRRR